MILSTDISSCPDFFFIFPQHQDFGEDDHYAFDGKFAFFLIALSYVSIPNVINSNQSSS
jgi:hypothetical protein